MKENYTHNEELGGKNLPDSLRVNPFLTPTHFFEEQENQILNQIHLHSLIRPYNDSQDNIATTQSVPNGYFETLTHTIFAKIAEQDLKDKVTDTGFSSPDQYFENLTAAIESRVAEEDIKSLVPELDFEVPDDYFESAENQILAKISENSLRDTIGQDAGFTTPHDYFEKSLDEIEAKITTEKWLIEIGKDHFTVPVGYFDQLNERILSKTNSTSSQQGQIITLPKRTSWKKYAVAAVALIIGTGAYFGFQETNSEQQTQQFASTEVNLENISDEEILNYLVQVSEGQDLIQLTKFASDTKEDNVQLDSDIDNKEIEEYLNYML